ncbi:uridine kinase [Amycolatopsis sp. H20-H5]|uniref:uridine kinase n=1 Tax=Amycolatopsis sp. H20-H5 TaxID=3046309 RepID=UPI002DB5F783|nr:uridine kinase [Amycolatopsis sp. H20-H5]MEC3978358.1 uridine kinase [Amycolatopsis sp. H20-H5]
MRYRPISPALLVAELTERVVAVTERRWIAVAIDGADGATNTTELADALVDPLRVLGRETLRVSARDFLKPASLRFEHGKENPDSRYYDWLDTGALRREVLEPLTDEGTGEVLPALWDTVRDRATRRDRVKLADGGVVVVDGELLLGAGLAFDVTVHLWLSPAALRRRLPPEAAWAAPAYERYEEETGPSGFADVVVRVDDPKHPALYLEGA